MKQKDIMLILVIVIIAGLISFFVTGMLFGDKSKDQKVEKVDAISTTFVQPAAKYFNEKSIDPAQIINVDNNDNTNPFVDETGL